MKIRWLRSALETRYAQLDYIARDNPGAAARMDGLIERQIDALADHPLMGRAGRIGDTRELVITRTPFVAVYRITTSHIEILRILHGA